MKVNTEICADMLETQHHAGLQAEIKVGMGQCDASLKEKQSHNSNLPFITVTFSMFVISIGREGMIRAFSSLCLFSMSDISKAEGGGGGERRQGGDNEGLRLWPPLTTDQCSPLPMIQKLSEAKPIP